MALTSDSEAPAKRSKATEASLTVVFPPGPPPLAKPIGSRLEVDPLKDPYGRLLAEPERERCAVLRLPPQRYIEARNRILGLEKETRLANPETAAAALTMPRAKVDSLWNWLVRF
jgi:hypothetical protein